MVDPQGLKPGTPNHGLKNRGLRRARAPLCQETQAELRPNLGIAGGMRLL
jgi:hypothetical protein